MKIAVLGKGMVGGTLGRRWAELGHEVTFGVRDPSAPEATTLAEETGAAVTGVAGAAAGADVVVVAVPFAVAADVLAQAGDLSGTIVIDTTNAVGEGYVPAVPTGTSAADAIAAAAPGAHVVKAFNAMSFRTMADPGDFPIPPSVWIASDDPDARATVAELAAELGLEPIDAGPLAAAVLLEHAAILWIKLAYTEGFGRDFAFALVRRDGAD